MKLAEYLRGKTLTRGVLCEGSILYFAFDGGALETVGGNWSLEVNDRIIETSETIEGQANIDTLVGRTIHAFNILTSDSCEITFQDGSVLRCWNGAYDGYDMGRGLLNIFQDHPVDRSWVCELHVPLVDISWRRADQPIPTFR